MLLKYTKLTSKARNFKKVALFPHSDWMGILRLVDGLKTPMRPIYREGSVHSRGENQAIAFSPNPLSIARLYQFLWTQTGELLGLLLQFLIRAIAAVRSIPRSVPSKPSLLKI